MLKILSPLARLEDVEPLIQVGADEFYAGFNNELFKQANKRENPKASFSDIETLKAELEE